MSASAEVNSFTSAGSIEAKVEVIGSAELFDFTYAGSLNLRTKFAGQIELDAFASTGVIGAVVASVSLELLGRAELDNFRSTGVARVRTKSSGQAKLGYFTSASRIKFKLPPVTNPNRIVRTNRRNRLLASDKNTPAVGVASDRTLEYAQEVRTIKGNRKRSV